MGKGALAPLGTDFHSTSVSLDCPQGVQWVRSLFSSESLVATLWSSRPFPPCLSLLGLGLVESGPCCSQPQRPPRHIVSWCRGSVMGPVWRSGPIPPVDHFSCNHSLRCLPPRAHGPAAVRAHVSSHLHGLIFLQFHIAIALGLNNVPSPIRVHLEPQNGVSFGNRAFADVIVSTEMEPHWIQFSLSSDMSF
jgi:hypothetical protein